MKMIVLEKDRERVKNLLGRYQGYIRKKYIKKNKKNKRGDE